jgi:hypothetical protein
MANSDGVPAPRLMLDSVDAMGRTKFKWLRHFHISPSILDTTAGGRRSQLISAPCVTRRLQNWNKIDGNRQDNCDVVRECSKEMATTLSRAFNDENRERT